MKRTLTASNERKGLKDTGLTHGQFYLAGAAAGLSNGFLACPIEHIRIRLQTQGAGPAVYKGPIDCIRKITSASGTTGLFRGFYPTLLREGHGMGAYFLTFEALVDRDLRNNNITRKDIPGWRLCTYGAMAGYAMWITAYPVDVIKSKLQTDKLSLSERQYKNSLDCAKKIFQTNGIKGFFRGFLPTMLRAAPVNACTFYTFELTIRYLG